MPDLAARWLSRLKQTMAIDVGRFMRAGYPPKAIVEALFDIPEVSQAFHLRANRRQPLAVDPSTPEERQEIVDALTRVADWLGSDFDAEVSERLREIAADLEGSS